MTDKQPFSYTVLRYVHDVMTGEFINVGVVVHAPSFRFLGIKTRRTFARLRDAFPNLDSNAFKSAMRSIERAIRKKAKEHLRNDLLPPVGDATSFASSVLAGDDSSLQWSPIGAGLTDDPQATLDRLYDRLVARYDSRQRERLTEEEIWRPVRQRLEERNIAFRLQEKVIRGRADEITFHHAWKNGVWHCYEPVSLDLADADGIKQKARGWLGHLTAVVEGAEPFQAHFIVGAPRNSDLMAAYRSAVEILRKAPNAPEIYEEHQVEMLVEQIEREVLAHIDPPRMI
jgi:hypothetical protein